MITEAKKGANKKQLAFLPYILYESLHWRLLIAAAALQTLTVFVTRPHPAHGASFTYEGKFAASQAPMFLPLLKKDYFMTNTLSLWTCLKFS